MASIKERVSGALERAREKHPLLDHAIRMQQHYGEVKAGIQAGGVTYYAFLSFFPLLALAFFVVGYVAQVYPQARDNLKTGIEGVLPHIVGTGPGQISLDSVAGGAAAAGVIGVLGLLYSGLGWLSALRTALLVVFEEPQSQQPNFFVGKLRDLVSLVAIGVVLVVSVAISSLVTGFSGKILDWVGLGAGATFVVFVLGLALGIAADMVLFYALFRLLAVPRERSRSLWSGALLGALAFEVLKLASTYLLGSTSASPAFQAFGIALILLVWINYFSRVVLYAASWAHTSTHGPKAVARPVLATARAEGSAGPDGSAPAPAGRRTPPPEPTSGTWFAAGAAAMLALMAVLKRRKRS